MVQNSEYGFRPDQKRELWYRWSEGESLSHIGRALHKHRSIVRRVLLRHGGFEPAIRTRSARSLTLEDREEISRGLARGHSIRTIAVGIGRAPSTVSREVARNGGRARYRAHSADNRAWDRARRPKTCRLGLNGRLRNIVARKLAMEWSPEQIAGWLRRTYTNDPTMHVSHETIYKSLFIQTRGVLKTELQEHLRTKRAFRHARNYTTRGQVRGHIIDGIPIAARPPEVEDRAVPGHWEGDLISGSRNTYIATLVERKTRFTMLVKVDGKDTESVVGALIRHVGKLPAQLRESLTWDRGLELAEHKAFTLATDTEVYFCDPRSPWQRGTNENTNRLLRQYFPKSTDLSIHSQADLNRVAKRLNQRPRKTLNYETPAEKLQEDVASIN